MFGEFKGQLVLSPPLPPPQMESVISVLCVSSCLWKEFSPGRLVVISAVDSFSSLLIKCLEKDGFSVPRDLGVVSTDGLEAYAGSPNPISSLKIPTVEMGEKALSLLLGEIRQRREIPVQNFQLNSTMFFGTTL